MQAFYAADLVLDGRQNCPNGTSGTGIGAMLRGGVTIPAAVVLVRPLEVLACTAHSSEATLLG
jgi:hypothetical protein